MKEPWDQRLDETTEQYRQFLWWRDQVPRPPPSAVELAHHFDWSRRAAAWDAVKALPQDDIGRLRFALRATIEVVAIEMNKMREVSRSSTELAISPKELAQIELRAFQILDVLQKRDAEQSASVDTDGTLVEESEITADDCRLLLAAMKSRG